ncbi:MAG: sigma-54-dependent transcriptional regulator [Brachymonas sp.]
MSADPIHILVVDDEPDLRELYELTLMRLGYRIHTAGSVAAARAAIASRSFDAVISDMRLPDGLGLEVLAELQKRGRKERAIVITAYGSAENAVEALKAGAFDYISKPVDLQQLRSLVAAAVAECRGSEPEAAVGRQMGELSTPKTIAVQAGFSAQNAKNMPKNAEQTPAASSAAKNEQQSALAGGGNNSANTSANNSANNAALQRIIGSSSAIGTLREHIAKAARGMAPILLRGESGTGKELAAQAVHACSQRASGPFVAVNCGAIPESLLEAEFFGARKGSYTGANADREGFFQAAHGGTLFLDELGDLPLAMQAKLLRVIQERKVRPLGATKEEPVDVRIVSATHYDLAAAVQGKSFRQDLYYRLNVIELILPPLRERRSDIPAIAQVLLAKIAADSGLPLRPLSPQAQATLQVLPLAGNVRELENILQRALAMSEGELLEIDAPGLDEAALRAIEKEAVKAGFSAQNAKNILKNSEGEEGGASALPGALPGDLPADLGAYLDSIERQILVRALQENNYNRTATAQRLGITLRQVRYRIQQLGIDCSEGGCEGSDD